MRKDAIYARQSVDKKDSVSIETQIEKCEVVAGKDSFIFKDKGYSGKNTDRPDLAKLISDIKEDKVNRVIVYRLDRISRNIIDFYKLLDIMDKHHTSFVSVTENFQTDDK
ncbi:MAG: recombinase family protein, partial [Eubacterium sp.]|nr:recombinase family protein [Eubacterium sp.]